MNDSLATGLFLACLFLASVSVIGVIGVSIRSNFEMAKRDRKIGQLESELIQRNGQIAALMTVVNRHYPNELAQALNAAA